MKRIIIILALTVLIAVLPGPAAAQSGATLTLRHLETEAFPLISGYLDARDSTGAPITDLQASRVQALEDGQQRAVTELRTVQTGLRVILVINPAEPFNIRDSQGTTRFDYAKAQILDWANSLPSNSATSLSLITPDGIILSDESAAPWIAALEAIQPDFPQQDVNTQTLVRALELSAQAGPEPGMGTAIWWLTATPPLETLATLPDWQAVLAEGGIPLFIWQVDARSNFETEATQSLQTLAQGSGGQWFGFSGGEEFPLPESYFNPFRSAYFFLYSSQLSTAGVHQVQLQMDAQGTLVTSQALSFELDIQPPNPILVTPPAQIERSPSSQDPRQLAPFSQPIEIMVEFPDDFERNLVRTALFVNDERVAENTSAPFTRFVWDLSGYEVSQQALLRVEAEDELGLVGSSIEFPVQLLVTNPPSAFQAFLARGGPVLVVTGVLIATATFFLVMVLSGWFKPARLGAKLFRRPQPAPQAPDPLHDSPLPSGEAKERGGTPDPKHFRAAPAYLQRLTIHEVNEGPQIWPINQDQVLIGAAKDCTLSLQEESVSPQHARLVRGDDGTYQVADLGSEAGTWVNYAPVSAEGSSLRDGDLLHIGRVAFRFLLQSSNSDSSESA
ncbi:MAG: FHA domain-containing protein [Chloroflexi bacterium]|nr:FHA domain-containing protein [Chloroflexota bacterium]